MSVRVVDSGLFASVAPLALRGSSCPECAAVVFPAASSCPACSATDVSEVVLPTHGSVWSWTTQRFAPKPPFRTDEFRPFSIGYVDLGPVIVEGWLVGRTEWAIGEPVRLVLAHAWTDEDGEPVHTFGFEAA